MDLCGSSREVEITRTLAWCLQVLVEALVFMDPCILPEAPLGQSECWPMEMHLCSCHLPLRYNNRYRYQENQDCMY